MGLARSAVCCLLFFCSITIPSSFANKKSASPTPLVSEAKHGLASHVFSSTEASSSSSPSPPGLKKGKEYSYTCYTKQCKCKKKKKKYGASYPCSSHDDDFSKAHLVEWSFALSIPMPLLLLLLLQTFLF